MYIYSCYSSILTKYKNWTGWQLDLMDFLDHFYVQFNIKKIVLISMSNMAIPIILGLEYLFLINTACLFCILADPF